MLYVVVLSAIPAVDVNRVQNVLGPAHSWYRIAPNSWVICTGEPAAAWNARLSPFVKPNGSIVIFRLDTTDRQGWIQQKFWEWVREHEGDFY